MKRKCQGSLMSSFVTAVFLLASCTKPPIKSKYKEIGGIVIGKETCNTGESKDCWLLDFTVYPNSPQIGDTLFFNGTTYTNVVKLTGLAPGLKQPGIRVYIDYERISSNKIITTGCTVANPITYPLKELVIINQGEIR